MKRTFDSSLKKLYEQFIKHNYCEFTKGMFDSLRRKVYEQFIKLNHCKFMKCVFDSLRPKVYEQFIKLNYCEFMLHIFYIFLQKVHKQFMKRAEMIYVLHDCEWLHGWEMIRTNLPSTQFENCHGFEFTNHIFNSISIVLQIIWKGSCCACISQMRCVLSYPGSTNGVSCRRSYRFIQSVAWKLRHAIMFYCLFIFSLPLKYNMKLFWITIS